MILRKDQYTGCWQAWQRRKQSHPGVVVSLLVLWVGLVALGPILTHRPLPFLSYWWWRFLLTFQFLSLLSRPLGSSQLGRRFPSGRLPRGFWFLRRRFPGRFGRGAGRRFGVTGTSRLHCCFFFIFFCVSLFRSVLCRLFAATARQSRNICTPIYMGKL